MSTWSAIRRILTLTCDESTQLMSESFDRELPWAERAAFRLHALICRSCRRAYGQLRFIKTAARRAASHGLPEERPRESEAGLSPQARLRMENALRQARAEGDD